jgi:hypothetical protein
MTFSFHNPKRDLRNDLGNVAGNSLTPNSRALACFVPYRILCQTIHKPLKSLGSEKEKNKTSELRSALFHSRPLPLFDWKGSGVEKCLVSNHQVNI